MKLHQCSVSTLFLKKSSKIIHNKIRKIATRVVFINSSNRNNHGIMKHIVIFNPFRSIIYFKEFLLILFNINIINTQQHPYFCMMNISRNCNIFIHFTAQFQHAWVAWHMIYSYPSGIWITVLDHLGLASFNTKKHARQMMINCGGYNYERNYMFNTKYSWQLLWIWKMHNVEKKKNMIVVWMAIYFSMVTNFTYIWVHFIVSIYLFILFYFISFIHFILFYLLKLFPNIPLQTVMMTWSISIMGPWQNFLHYWSFWRGINLSPVDSPEI